jgi:hypothetical protein
MRIYFFLLLFLPFTFFFILGPYSFVSSFDTLENYLPIYKFLYSSNLNNIDFSLGINSGEPYLAYGWYPWLQIFFFNVLPLYYAYQITLLVFLLVNCLGNYLLLRKCFSIDKNTSYFFTLLSTLILLRTASLDIGHLVCSSLSLWIIFLYTKQNKWRINLLLILLFSLIVTSLAHIQYIPIHFIYTFLFSIIFFRNFQKVFLFFLLSSVLVILIRHNELFSIYNNLGSSGRSLTSINFSFSYILIEHIAPVIDLFFLKIRSIFFIILLFFTLFFIKYSKGYFDIIIFLLTMLFIPFLNIIFVDRIFFLDKLRIYSILAYFPNMVIFISAYLLNNYFITKGLKYKKIIIILISLAFSFHIIFFNTNHLMTWLYNGNLKSISLNPHIEKIKKNESSNFRVATYGFFTNFPLYYDLESIGGYAPVSNSNSRNFWNDFNDKALKKYPSLKDSYLSSFNHNSFLNLLVTDYDYKFDEIFDLKKLAERNTKYIISRGPILSNDLRLIYEPKYNSDQLPFTEKLLKLLKYNFNFHDTFYIYIIDGYKSRMFATDKNENVLNFDNLFSFKYENNKYLIDINTKGDFLIFLNHFYDDNWICNNLLDKKSVKIIKNSSNFIGFRTLNLSQVECYYKY